MVIRVPLQGKRDLSDDPWITLAEAVRWAAWRGEPEPMYGSQEFEDGTWVSHGDMEEEDRLVYARGAEEVRKALAAGRLDAWAQTGYDEPIQLPKARWSGQVLGAVVSWVEYYHPFDRIIVERDRVEQLWFKERGASQSDTLGTFPASRLRNELEHFDEAKSEWLELWQGPLNFRATYDRGKFGPGTSLERINQYGSDGASGKGRYTPIYAVWLDAEDSAIVIEWLTGLPGRLAPYSTTRYYHGGMGRGFYDRLRTDLDFRDQQLAHVPANLRERAIGAYSSAITIREWSEREFFQAVHAGQCEIWARRGSKIAPFRRVPADIFQAYKIQEWGYGVPGGAWASLDGAEPIYAIYVAPTKAETDGDRVAPMASMAARRGRTKGSGSLEAADAPLLVEMRKMIAAGEAFSPDGAAKLVASRAKGGGTFDSRATRLANRYRASEKK